MLIAFVLSVLAIKFLWISGFRTEYLAAAHANMVFIDIIMIGAFGISASMLGYTIAQYLGYLFSVERSTVKYDIEDWYFNSELASTFKQLHGDFEIVANPRLYPKQYTILVSGVRTAIKIDGTRSDVKIEDTHSEKAVLVVTSFWIPSWFIRLFATPKSVRYTIYLPRVH